MSMFSWWGEKMAKFCPRSCWMPPYIKKYLPNKGTYVLYHGLRTPKEGTIQKISEKLGWCGRQNTLWPYLKIWEWEWIFGHAVNAISSLGVRSPCPIHYVLFIFVLCPIFLEIPTDRSIEIVPRGGPPLKMGCGVCVWGGGGGGVRL